MYIRIRFFGCHQRSKRAIRTLSSHSRVRRPKATQTLVDLSNKKHIVKRRTWTLQCEPSGGIAGFPLCCTFACTPSKHTCSNPPDNFYHFSFVSCSQNISTLEFGASCPLSVDLGFVTFSSSALCSRTLIGILATPKWKLSAWLISFFTPSSSEFSREFRGFVGLLEISRQLKETAWSEFRAALLWPSFSSCQLWRSQNHTFSSLHQSTGTVFNNKLASSVDAIAISKTFNHSPTDWQG